MRRPNVFIVGAPKCGTTTLAAWLSTQPQAFVSSVKEPHYFNSDGRRVVTTLEEYEHLFSPASTGHLVIAEASTHYLISQTAVPNILTYNDRAKFVVCIRNPIEMAASLHSERVWHGEEPLESFEDAWAVQSDRAAGRQIPKAVADFPERLQYGELCSLGSQLRRLLETVPRDRVHVQLLDDLASHPVESKQGLGNFLGIKVESNGPFAHMNRRKHVPSARMTYLLMSAVRLKTAIGVTASLGLASRLRRWLTVAQAPSSLPTQLHATLAEYFQPEIELLESLLDRSLAHWLPHPSTPH